MYTTQMGHIYATANKNWHIVVTGGQTACGKVMEWLKFQDLESPPQNVCKNCLRVYYKMEKGE